MPVYQYGGLHYDLPDGLSNEQALAKIKTHLGEASAPKAEEPSMLSTLGQDTLGTAAAVGDILSGVVKMPLSIGAAIGGKLRGGQEYNLQELRGAGQQAVEDVLPSIGKSFGLEQTGGYKATMKPFELLGEGVGYLGNKISQLTGSKELGGAAELGSDIAMMGMGIPGAKYVGKGLAKVAETIDPALRNKKPTVRDRGDLAREDLVAAEKPETAATSNDPLYVALQKEKAQILGSKRTKDSRARLKEIDSELQRLGTEAAAQAIRERELAQQSAFNRPEEVPYTERQTPMERMASELGAEPFVEGEPFNPAIGNMADQLSGFGETTRAAAHEAARLGDEQARLRQTQMEQEIARQASLERGARTLGQTDTGFAEHAWEQQQREQMQLDKATQDMAKVKEQLDAFQRQLDEEKAQAKTEADARHYAEIQQKLDAARAQMELDIKRQTRQEMSAAQLQRNEAAGTGFARYQAEQSIPARVEAHPAVAKAAERVAKQEQLIIKLQMRVNEGKAPGTQLVRAVRDLKNFEATEAKARENITKALSDEARTIPSPFDEGGGITYLRSGFSKEDLARAVQQLHESAALKGASSQDRLRETHHSMIGSPQEAVAMANMTKDVAQTNILEKAIKGVTGGFVDATGKLNTNLLTKGGIYLKSKINHPVLHYTVDTILDAHARANAQVTNLVHREYLPSLRKLSDKEYTEVFKALEAADKAATDITPEMMDKWGFSDNMKAAVETHQRGMKEAFTKINEALTSMGLDPIKERKGYSAFNMTGDFRALVVKDGQVIGAIGHDLKKSYDKIKQDLQEKDPSITFTEYPPGKQGFVKGSPNAAFQQALQKIGKDNPGTQELLALLQELGRSDPSTYMGMNKHTMAKKGVYGMEGRKPWKTPYENAIEFFDNQAAYLESSVHWAELSTAIAKVNDVIRNPDVAVKHPKAVEFAEDFVYRTLGVDSISKAFEQTFNKHMADLGIGPSVVLNAAQKAKAVTNAILLSFLNLPFLVVNAIQPLTGLPGHAAFLRAVDGASGHTALTLGYDHFAQGMMTALKEASGMKLSPLEQGAFDYVKTHEVYSSEMVERQKHTRAGPSYYSDRFLKDPAALVETNSRRSVYLSFVHMLNNAGITPEQGLYQQAHRATDKVMGHYGTLERSPLYSKLGPMGVLAVNLVNFKHNELSRWSEYARELVKHGAPSPILTQMAAAIVFAGVMGLPFSSEITALYDELTKAAGKPRSLELDVMDASKNLGKAVGDDAHFMLSHGVLTKFGIDPSKKLGMPDAIPNTVAEFAFGGGSKLGNSIMAVGRAIGTPDEANAKAAAYAAAPTSVQGMLDRMWYEGKGGETYMKDPTKRDIVTGRRNDLDKLYRSIGFAGIHETTEKTKQYQQNRLDKAYQEYRSSAMVDLSHTLRMQGTISQKALDKYFVTGQGDSQTFERDLNNLILQQSITPQEYTMMKQAASSRIPQMQSLIRRAQ